METDKEAWEPEVKEKEPEETLEIVPDEEELLELVVTVPKQKDFHNNPFMLEWFDMALWMQEAVHVEMHLQMKTDPSGLAHLSLGERAFRAYSALVNTAG